jgi:hypothetical protein
MIALIEKFLRYICGSLSCKCKSSCIDRCQNHEDRCVCACMKKDDEPSQSKAVVKSLKETTKETDERTTSPTPS